MKKTKLPKQIPVGNRFYRIILQKNFADQTGTLGVCDPRARTITLDAGLDAETFERVLVHEIVHAFDCEYGFSQVLDRQAMELHADNLANFLTSIFRFSFR